MLDETVKPVDQSFKPARKVEQGKKKFGEGIEALAKAAPGLLVDLATKSEAHSSLGAEVVMGEIEAAKDKGAKKTK